MDDDDEVEDDIRQAYSAIVTSPVKPRRKSMRRRKDDSDSDFDAGPYMSVTSEKKIKTEAEDDDYEVIASLVVYGQVELASRVDSVVSFDSFESNETIGSTLLLLLLQEDATPRHYPALHKIRAPSAASKKGRKGKGGKNKKRGRNAKSQAQVDKSKHKMGEPLRR